MELWKRLFLPDCVRAKAPAVWIFEALLKTLCAVNP